jgi:hypothetical protein
MVAGTFLLARPKKSMESGSVDIGPVTRPFRGDRFEENRSSLACRPRHGGTPGFTEPVWSLRPCLTDPKGAHPEPSVIRTVPGDPEPQAERGIVSP